MPSPPAGGSSKHPPAHNWPVDIVPYDLMLAHHWADDEGGGALSLVQLQGDNHPTLGACTDAQAACGLPVGDVLDMSCSS